MKFFAFQFCLLALLARSLMASTQSNGTLNLVAVVPEKASVQIAAAVAQDSGGRVSFHLVSNAPMGLISIQAYSAADDPDLFFKWTDCGLVPTFGLVFKNQVAVSNPKIYNGVSDFEICKIRIVERSNTPLISNSRILNKDQKLILEIRAI
ncbi:MAG: hypothetical protein AABZ55_10275 [Bdellovibrionota bacterium]